MIGNAFSQYGSSTFYKGLRFIFPSEKMKEESPSNSSIIGSTNDGVENEKKHETERYSKFT